MKIQTVMRYSLGNASILAEFLYLGKFYSEIEYVNILG